MALNLIEINTVSQLNFNRFLVFSNIPLNIILQKCKKVGSKGPTLGSYAFGVFL